MALKSYAGFGRIKRHLFFAIASRHRNFRELETFLLLSPTSCACAYNLKIALGLLKIGRGYNLSRPKRVAESDAIGSVELQPLPKEIRTSGALYPRFRSCGVW